MNRLMIAISTALLLSACGSETEEAKQKAGEMADEAREVAEEVSDDVKAAAKDVGDAAQEAYDDASAAVQDVYDEASTAAVDDGDDCTLGIEVGDNIAYSTDSLSVPASCAEVTVTITHTGQLPAVAMGHNWVLVPADALDSVAQAGMAAGADAGYVPDDDRIVAATTVVGGGESDSVTFSLDALQDSVSYRYVCTFPGHSTVMQGSFTVSG